MAQLMPLPLIGSCLSKSQIGFTFLVQAHPGSPGQRAVKWVCVLYSFFQQFSLSRLQVCSRKPVVSISCQRKEPTHWSVGMGWQVRVGWTVTGTLLPLMSLAAAAAAVTSEHHRPQ